MGAGVLSLRLSSALRVAGVAICALIAGAAATPAWSAAEQAIKPATKLKIAFAGDSLVDNYWEGILHIISSNPCLKTSVELGRYARNGTGLSRGDKLYWPREVRRIGETFKPNLFVLSIGLNDQQFIVDGAGRRTAWGAPDWTDRYREQIVEFLKGAAANNAGVMLVGLPVVRSSTENADLQAKNKMFVEAVAELGATHVEYVEPWRLKSAGEDVFASYGLDRNGRMVQIRTPDGEHFTAAGEDIVAAYLYPKIVTAFAQMGTPLDRACAGPEKAVENSAASAEQRKDP